MMVITEMSAKQKKVLTYLKKMKLQNESYYSILILFGVNPNDIIKYIERPEDCGKWPFDFVCQVENAVNQIAKKYLMDFPDLEIQTEEDRVLSKLLAKNNFYAFGTNIFFKNDITVHHIIAFMERNDVIYEWNGDFILRVQQLAKRVNEILL